jgi:hypothetical protein
MTNTTKHETAQAVDGAIRVLYSYAMDGARFVEVPCADYDALRALPTALMFDGLVYGRTGWNSDDCKAYYRTGVALARSAR